MSEPAAFGTLALNRRQNGRPYIALGAQEHHYHAHMQVVEGVFGPETPFESKAAVTELFLCASPGTPATLDQAKSPCAERYLGRVLDLVRPKVVIAVGSTVQQHLEQHFDLVVRAPIVWMVHPRNLWGATPNERSLRLHPTIDLLKQILGPRHAAWEP